RIIKSSGQITRLRGGRVAIGDDPALGKDLLAIVGDGDGAPAGGAEIGGQVQVTHGWLKIGRLDAHDADGLGTVGEVRSARLPAGVEWWGEGFSVEVVQVVVGGGGLTGLRTP